MHYCYLRAVLFSICLPKKLFTLVYRHNCVDTIDRTVLNLKDSLLPKNQKGRSIPNPQMERIKPKLKLITDVGIQRLSPVLITVKPVKLD